MKTTNVTALKPEVRVEVEELGCLTSKPANVEAFLRALANDANHRTYYVACEDTFGEMAEAVRAYFTQLTEAEGAEMPGLEELQRALRAEE
jgi:hypothetical protein